MEHPLHFPYAAEQWFWYLYVFTSHIITACALILWIWHLINVCSDFCTKQRKSVKWRDTLPSISKSYIALLICSFSMISFFLLTSIGLSLSQWAILSNYCSALVLNETFLYYIAKEFMYLTFILKLYIVYNGTKFAYNQKRLILTAIISIILFSMNCLVSFIYREVHQVIFYDDLSYAMQCSFYYPLFLYCMVGAGDMIMSIAFLIAFILPLKTMANKQDNDQDLLNIGIKSLILTATAAISTLIFLLSLLFSHSAVGAPFDCFINSVCIILMTPYYSDTRYYSKLCCILIKVTSKIVAKSAAKPVSKPELELRRYIQSTSSTSVSNKVSTSVTSSTSVQSTSNAKSVSTKQSKTKSEISDCV